MSHLDDAFTSLMAASRQIADTGQYLDACVHQIDGALGLVHQASDSGFTGEKDAIRGLMDECCRLQLTIRGVADQVASAAGRVHAG